jgi:hypothetical protein
MAYRIECPMCRRVGLVRAEQVIIGASAAKAYYCGGCNHQWAISEPAAKSDGPQPLKPSSRIGPKRRD